VRKPGGRRLATLSRSRFSLAALILVLSVLAIAPMAGASTPDPLWIEGMYDGADRDDAAHERSHDGRECDKQADDDNEHGPDEQPGYRWFRHRDHPFPSISCARSGTRAQTCFGTLRA